MNTNGGVGETRNWKPKLEPPMAQMGLAPGGRQELAGSTSRPGLDGLVDLAGWFG